MMYHGTVSTFVPDILKYGLVPKPTNAWKVEVYFDWGQIMAPNDNDRIGNIYLSSDKRDSIWYAVNKAAYYRTEPKHLFMWSQYDVDNDDKLEPMFKAKRLDNGLYVPDAKPVLFQVTITPSVKKQLVPDEKDARKAVRCLCTIPAKYLKLVWQG